MYNNNQGSGPYGGSSGGGVYGSEPSASYGAPQQDRGPFGSSQQSTGQQSTGQQSSAPWNPAAGGQRENDASGQLQPPPAAAGAIPPSYWNPGTAAAAVKLMSGGGSDAAVDAARQIATQFAVDGWARFVPGLEKFMTTLRVYFAVDNKYVKRKLTTTLFPFLKKNWRRTVSGTLSIHHDCNSLIS
jgi:hypothetical protein